MGFYIYIDFFFWGGGKPDSTSELYRNFIFGGRVKTTQSNGNYIFHNTPDNQIPVFFYQPVERKSREDVFFVFDCSGEIREITIVD